ncbi:hypothetical protein BDZ89DRAFT_504045 [Hymenopellis radicata]|nr:hypothetical protein BDZ89DRAFT_504045 [Hymenopellis radicata]
MYCKSRSKTINSVSVVAFVPRGIDEELFPSFNASEHVLERRQTSCPAPEPLDTAPAQAAAALAAASVAAAALAELSADAALLAAVIAARRLIDEIQHDVDVVQQVVSGSLPSSELATAIEGAAAALSDFDDYIFVNDTSEDNQTAQDIMNGIDDAATDAFSFMQNVMSIMNNDIPDDDGSFGATVLVPGDVSTTSVAPTTTFVESVTPPPPPPTTTDELPAPTASDNSFGHLIRRSYADMSDVTDGALAHATISDCRLMLCALYACQFL